MNINAVFPSKYVKCHDLKGQDLTLTIKSVTIEKMRDQDERPVVYFSGATKGLVLNKTNAGTISNMYGCNTDNWIGKPISLHPTECEAFGEIVECIRVRPHAPSVEAPVPTPAPEPTPPPDPVPVHQAVADDDIPF